jgi:hypothetical protein
MAAKAGANAQKTGDFYCAKGDEKVHVTRGDQITKCPHGHSELETRRNEPGNKSWRSGGAGALIGLPHPPVHRFSAGLDRHGGQRVRPGRQGRSTSTVSILTEEHR